MNHTFVLLISWRSQTEDSRCCGVLIFDKLLFTLTVLVMSCGYQFVFFLDSIIYW